MVATLVASPLLGLGRCHRIRHMSTTTTQQPHPQSLAQMQDETLRLLAETNLLNARQAKARAEREARFYARYPIFARHDWLLPALATSAAMGTGAGVVAGIFMLVSR
jgi:hypothetical protein